MAAQHDDDFAAYVNGRLPVLRRVAAQLAGDTHRGDDLVQQAITRLYTRWKRASATENLDGYVYKILSRVFLDEQRRRWATVRLGTSAADLAERSGGSESVPAGDFAAGVADRMLLRDALALLAPKQRAVVVLRFLADRSVEEVAEILKISPGTVKSQTHDGLTVLRRLLGARLDAGLNPGGMS